LLKNFQFAEEDIHLNSRTFLWPKDMEAVLELSQARLSHRRDMVEGVLRSKRSDFDAK
jgi:dynein heavy chain